MIVRDLGKTILALRGNWMYTRGSLPAEVTAHLGDVITSTWSIVVVREGIVTMESAFGRSVATAGHLLITVPGSARFHFSADHAIAALTIKEQGDSPRSPWKSLSVPMVRQLDTNSVDDLESVLGEVATRPKLTDEHLIEVKRLIARQLWLREDRRARDVLHSTLRAFWRTPHEATLESVARGSGYTKTYLNDLMRGTTGTSLSTWLQGVRMNRARHELIWTSDAVATVGARCGYYDSAYFSRAFSRFHGVPPTRWRALPDPRPTADTIASRSQRPL